MKLVGRVGSAEPTHIFTGSSRRSSTAHPTNCYASHILLYYKLGGKQRHREACANPTFTVPAGDSPRDELEELL
ncbi:hypothetical protein [[Phormidium] sp. ETS-05]|uniref:hypothetical protein n=1 Tax=[Phormidium] sp. ETS-05 TaxID=222819 RepID=UPI0018EEFCF7|nr:hypothetical protein [[Phormidium] sp. ETS-05]